MSQLAGHYSLLDLGGQLFAKIIQQRVQSERVLPESQCGCQSGRGCADDILWRQLMEKAIEHNTIVFMLCINLHKAYDSIPQDALWRVLAKYGVPPSMKAEVTVDGQFAPDFEVCNGLRQGCVIGP